MPPIHALPESDTEEKLLIQMTRVTLIQSVVVTMNCMISDYCEFYVVNYYSLLKCEKLNCALEGPVYE